MTPAEQNRAIAEWVGWTGIIFRGIVDPKEMDYVGSHESCRPEGATGRWQGMIPDYTSDLNVIHKAEKNLKDELRSQYEDELLPYNPTYATAAQRAEALLRTIGKWKE